MSCYRAPVEVESIDPIIGACEFACTLCCTPFTLVMPLGAFPAWAMYCPVCHRIGGVRDIDQITYATDGSSSIH